MDLLKFLSKHNPVKFYFLSCGNQELMSTVLDLRSYIL